jgi:hypothetical protein
VSFDGVERNPSNHAAEERSQGKHHQLAGRASVTALASVLLVLVVFRKDERFTAADLLDMNGTFAGCEPVPARGSLAPSPLILAIGRGFDIMVDDDDGGAGDRHDPAKHGRQLAHLGGAFVRLGRLTIRKNFR